MNRNKLVEAMEARFRMFSTHEQLTAFSEALRLIVRDADLVVAAKNMGIDTNILFTEAAK